MACPNCSSCRVLHRDAEARDVWRVRFCETPDAFRECALYRRVLFGRPVPVGLLPNGRTATSLAA